MTALRATPDPELEQLLRAAFLPSHRAYIERRMERGEYARAVARDLWFWLRLTIREARGSGDDLRAAQLTRQLVYLCSHYNTETESDCYQGIDGGLSRVPSSPAPNDLTATKES